MMTGGYPLLQKPSKESSLALSFNEDVDPIKLTSTESILTCLYSKIKDKGGQKERQEQVNQKCWKSYIQEKENRPRESKSIDKKCNDEMRAPLSEAPLSYLLNPHPSQCDQSLRFQNWESERKELLSQISLLRSQLSKSSQKAMQLNCYMEEVQYLKKLTYLQSEEIQKLRRMLKAFRVKEELDKKDLMKGMLRQINQNDVKSVEQALTMPTESKAKSISKTKEKNRYKTLSSFDLPEESITIENSLHSKPKSKWLTDSKQTRHSHHKSQFVNIPSDCVTTALKGEKACKKLFKKKDLKHHLSLNKDRK